MSRYHSTTRPLLDIGERHLIISQLQHGHEGLLWNFHVTDHFQAFLAFFLFFEQFLLAGDIAAVAFGKDIFTRGPDIRPADDAPARGGLYALSNEGETLLGIYRQLRRKENG